MNELIANFRNITKLSREEAIFYLNSANKNLEFAISLYMDSSGPHNSSINPPQKIDSSKASYNSDEKIVPPPLPPKRSILVENDDQLYFRRQSNRKKDSVFSFRDFNAETKDIEQKLNLKASNSKEYSHLEKLFRPPFSIMHRGTFESGKSLASLNKKWLMVDLHDSSEFCCQILNRDVWSQELIKSIIQEHFLFLQLDTDLKEGIQFKCFYKPKRYPAIYIIDPRTGEEMLQINESDLQNIITSISDYVQENPTIETFLPEGGESEKGIKPDDSPSSVPMVQVVSSGNRMEPKSLIKKIKPTPPWVIPSQTTRDSERPSTSKTYMAEENETRDDSGTCSDDSDIQIIPCTKKGIPKNSSTNSYSPPNSQNTKRKTLNFNDAEDASTTLNNFTKRLRIGGDKNGYVSDVITGDGSKYENASKLKAVPNANKDQLWHKCDGQDLNGPLQKIDREKFTFQIKFPNNTRTIVSFPEKCQIKNLMAYMVSMGYSWDKYEIVRNFPLTIISDFSLNSTFEDCGLETRETIFIQENSLT